MVPVVAVIEAIAMIVPTKTEFVPSVAELPTCQNTLHSCAPFMSAMVLSELVIKVESDRKMKTDEGSPCPSKTSDPVSERVDAPGPA